MIFADTSFFVAGIDRRDTHHSTAMALLKRIGRSEILTTNHVRGETWTALRRKLRHAKAVEFLESLDRPGGHVEVVHTPPDLEQMALSWLRVHDEREYSFVDATSFAFMRTHGIAEALAFDDDFAAAGFVELRP